MDVTFILATIAGILFVIPFFIWGVIRFIDKQRREVIYWKKTALLSSFGICFALGILFIVLAVVL